MPAETCASCAYYVPRIEVELRADVRGDGECHAAPPHAAHGWPAVDHADWCGRHRLPPPEPRIGPPPPPPPPRQIGPAGR